MPDTELAALQRAIGDLRQSLTQLRLRYGDTTAVRRIANDVDRLDIDAAELSALPVPRTAGQREMVVVSDTPYDPDLWRGADDEGVGGYRAQA
ncbi:MULTISPECIES: hypothetical protein [Crossiella]|uniref:Putative membrane protein YccC n=1 Tax=Crossiella cryophila TaxID=43355 RepID=A0A7W7C924_9PSEU|nr:MULTISPECIES: hypothetical protein [Crossiella]MBB4676765.1 putative membrane protein YccC [Crossiella cryophila]MCK2240224.1 hypothetical protein [Crossiella sp. S99.2]MCK2253324.1 hypothetical protein [Crossiella sp. S99.1]